MFLPKKHSVAGNTIFSEMTALAQKHNAVNLSQGFPDYEIDERLKKFLAEATDKNFNQYSPMSGNPMLIEALIHFNQKRKNPIHFGSEEVTISAGATYGIFAALPSVISFGDEVIVLKPNYDSYVPAIEMNGGKPIFVKLAPDFSPDFEALKSAISHKTKAIIINSPNNPSGKIWTNEQWNKLSDLLENTEIIVISDEVYDLLTYDDRNFVSAFEHPKLKERCFSIFSFGKMFHITGWKVGYVLASAELTKAYRSVHQYLAFSVNSPAQYALAKYLEIFDPLKNLKIMQEKRDFFVTQMNDLPFTLNEKAEAGYFQILRFEKISTLPDKEFAVWLTENAKVATIPVSAFYHDQQNTKTVRFCFAKKEETILEAVSQLKKFLN
jgi:methionine aminotransferase